MMCASIHYFCMRNTKSQIAISLLISIIFFGICCCCCCCLTHAPKAEVCPSLLAKQPSIPTYTNKSTETLLGWGKIPTTNKQNQQHIHC